MSQLNDQIQSNLALVVGVLGVVCLLLLLLVLIQMRRLGGLKRRLASITRGVDGENLERVLDAHLDTVLQVSRDLDELRERASQLEANGRLAFQRLGLVRFNPFEDTGGNQSFAVALLNADDNGYVMSSLHSRTGTRVYAKAINGGRSDTALSTEETEAVELARRGPSARSAAVRDAAREASRPAQSQRPVPAVDRSAAGGSASGGTGMASPGLAGERLDADFLERRLRGGAAPAEPSAEDRSRTLWEEPKGS